jgi:molecular chaperone HscB
MDLFQALGLPVAWNVSQETLSDAFRRESRKVHPDRFYNKSPAEKREAMARTTDITEAYRTLKDPLLRAVYLLRTVGKTIDERARVPDDPLLLSEVMEAREQTQELRAQGRAAEAPLTNIFKEFNEKARAAESGIGEAFRVVDLGQNRQEALDNLFALVIRHRYYSGTRDEIKRALDAVRY